MKNYHFLTADYINTLGRTDTGDAIVMPIPLSTSTIAVLSLMLIQNSTAHTMIPCVINDSKRGSLAFTAVNTSKGTAIITPTTKKGNDDLIQKNAATQIGGCLCIEKIKADTSKPDLSLIDPSTINLAQIDLRKFDTSKVDIYYFLKCNLSNVTIIKFLNQEEIDKIPKPKSLIFPKNIEDIPEDAKKTKWHFFVYLRYFKDGKNDFLIETAIKACKCTPGILGNRIADTLNYIDTSLKEIK